MTGIPDHVTTVLDELRAYLDEDATANIGFPSTLDVDFTPLWPFLNRPLNNVGDPFADSAYPLALPPGGRPRFDLADGSDSISISAHKFLGGCPFPAGIYLTARGVRDISTVDYVAAVMSTIACSRSDHAPLAMWYTVRTLGRAGLLARATRSRQVAAYAVEQLQRIGVGAWRHPYAMTVVLPTPLPEITQRWRLASSRGQSHIITLPGVTTQTIDLVVRDIAAHQGRGTADRSVVPLPRSPRPSENKHVPPVSMSTAGDSAEGSG